MNKSTFFLLVFVAIFIIRMPAKAQWTTSGTDIYNSNSGNVGIGTSSPATKLHVNGDITLDGGLLKFVNNYTAAAVVPVGTMGTTALYGTQIRAKTGTYYDLLIVAPNGELYMYAHPGSHTVLFGDNIIAQPTKKIFLDGGSNTYLTEVSADNIGFFTNGSEKLRINDNGQVGIGITSVPSGYKFAVAGNMITEKVRVKLQSAGWPDYVFHKSYSLPSLKEVEEFIKENNHLPGVPSATEIGKEGLDLGDGQAVLLKKIEELTLYVIELNKKVEILTAENEAIKKQIQRD